MHRRLRLPVLLLLLLAVRPACAELTFSVTYLPQIGVDSFTGRVYVMFSRSPREPRQGPVWFSDDPFYALDVVDWTPGEPLVFDDDAISYPCKLSEIRKGSWSVQAVMRRNLDSPSIGHAAGNAYSASRRMPLDPTSDDVVEMKINQVVPDKAPPKAKRIRYVTIPSKLLSDFRGRPVTMSAAVVLPENLEADRRYPTSYVIPGFSGTHRLAPYLLGRWKGLPGDDAMVRVLLDPSCYGGHHVFADSANNGPCGQALIEEMIPHIEAEFPVIADPDARFLTGHSSGGWSSLWLQVAYPDAFAGTWSTSPDPVDFRDFQLIDVYADGQNVLTDDAGNARPIARRGGKVIGRYRDMVGMEEVIGDGGQVRSFEWVFSPRGPDGRPLPLFDRTTGEIDPAVAAAWRAYDIREVIESNWSTLGPKLAGKLHVITGSEDNFYLEGAVRLLKASLAELGSDAVVEIVDGADHGSILTSDLMLRIDEEMLEAFARSQRQ